MPSNEIRFNDGAAYERFMGKWSAIAGEQFLDWLKPKSALRWLDVGCGNGAFTDLLIKRCGPSSLKGIDPSEQQLEYARQRSSSAIAEFQLGDAMALPFADSTFDAAVMPLVIFFVPQPAIGVAEMVRVVAPGGIVSAYAWDMLEGGFPYDALWNQMRAMGVEVPLPPSAEVSRMAAMKKVWIDAGLKDVRTRQITVQRTYTDFDDYWTTILGGPSVSRGLASMSQSDLMKLQSRMREILPTGFDGRITVSARANAVSGIR